MLVKSCSILALKETAALYGGAEANGKHWLFDTSSGRHFRLNSVGFHALSLTDGKRPLEEIITVCASKYGVARETIAKDLATFFEKCLRTKMVKVIRPKSLRAKTIKPAAAS